MENMLQARNLSVEYYRNKKTIKAVDKVSFELNSNETLSIVGESGCGKSTIAYSILSLINPAEGRITGGEIIYNGADLLKMNKDELQKIRGKEISIVFQDPFSSLNPVLTVGDQLTETILYHLDVPGGKTGAGELREKAFKLLKDVQLYDTERIYNSYPHQLSGGQRQRICIAIAISTNPKILIADEPTTALDVTTSKEIISLLLSLQNTLNMSIIFITHNLKLAFGFSHRIIVMYAGEFIEEGSAGEVLQNPMHPYTRMLLNVLPTIEKKGEKLPSIPGQVPDMFFLPEGCRFHPRCDRISDKCRKIAPGTKHGVDSGKSKVKCHLY